MQPALVMVHEDMKEPAGRDEGKQMKGGPKPAYIQVSDELTRFASWKAFRSWFQSGEIGEEDRVTAGRGRSHTAKPKLPSESKGCEANEAAVAKYKRVGSS